MAVAATRSKVHQAGSGSFATASRTWSNISRCIVWKRRLPELMPSGNLSRMSKRKNPAVVALGRLDGKARGKRLPKKKREALLTKIGLKGAAARWKKARKR